ncbi:MAG: ATP-dependent Clp protease proteolytic subunit [Chlamydiales bacterium]|nr:ATP-dependent Clp protease proteolytic subunit [Chlamydiales bacterium]
MSQQEEEKQKPLPIEEDIEKMLLGKRWIFFSKPVDDQSAREAIRKLWYLEFSNPGKPILLIINSPGGAVDSGFAVWDQIKLITSPVTTLVTGLAASMGSLLSLVPGRGKRFATVNARFMIHQPAIHGVIQGQATDLEIQAKEILKTRKQIAEIYVEATGKDFATIDRAIDRDTWLSAEEAKEFGLIDGIITSYKQIGF